MNSKHTLYNSIVKYSLDNDSTVTASENIRYLMSKYGIYEHEWHQPISICTIYNKINKFVVEYFNIDNQGYVSRVTPVMIGFLIELS